MGRYNSKNATNLSSYISLFAPPPILLLQWEFTHIVTRLRMNFDTKQTLPEIYYSKQQHTYCIYLKLI